MIEKILEECGALSGFFSPARGLHGAFEGEKFAEEVIQGESAVIRWPGIAEGIPGVIELTLHFTTEHEGAGETDGAKGIEAVGILDDLRLQGERGDAGGETVGLDGVGDIIQAAVRPGVGLQPFHGLACGEAGGEFAIGR